MTCEFARHLLFLRYQLENQKFGSLSILVVANLLLACQPIHAVQNEGQSSLERAQEIMSWPEFFRFSFSRCLLEFDRIGFDGSKEKCSGELSGYREELKVVSYQERTIVIAQVSIAEKTVSTDVSDIFFYVDGGPLDSFPRVPDQLTQYAGLQRNQLIIYPVYHSSWFRTTGDAREDLQKGLVELRAAHGGLRAQYPEATIHLIGESWGGYFASRIGLGDKDRLVLVSSPLNHTGNSLADFFRETITQEKKEGDTTYALSADDYSNQIAINRYRYVTEALRQIGGAPFVLARQDGHKSCRVIIYGTDDPMLASFDRTDGYSRANNEWVISRQTGHEVLAGYDGFFAEMGDLDCLES